MADVTLTTDRVDITISLLDRLLSFQGSFRIPLAHVTNAYVSSFEDLDLQYKLSGTNMGYESAVGVFGTPMGLAFVDVDDGGDCLVVETRGEKFPRIAVQLPADKNPNDVAHAIMRAIPDSGPVE